MPLSNTDKAILAVVLNYPASHDPHRDATSYLAEVVNTDYAKAQELMDKAEKQGLVVREYRIGYGGKRALEKALYEQLKAD